LPITISNGQLFCTVEDGTTFAELPFGEERSRTSATALTEEVHMRKFALSLALVLAFTAFAFAAARNDDTMAETRAEKAASGQKAKAKGHAASAKEAAPDDAKTGDITIKGKAGTVTHISYGSGPKTEPAAGAKGSGQ
jgi:hypothetical protein